MSELIGYYGKIPAFADFIKTESSSEHIRDFRHWLDKTFDNIVRHINDLGLKSNVIDSLGPHSLYVKLKDNEKPMIFLWEPSNDKSGRRSPFIIYTESILLSKNDHKLIPEIYSRFLTTARWCTLNSENCFNFDHQRNTIWSLREGLPFNSSPSNVKYQSFLHNKTLEDIINNLSEESNQNYGINLLNSIFIALVSSRDIVTEQFNAILKYPLGKNRLDNSLMIAFWIEFTSKVLHIDLSNSSLCWNDKSLSVVFSPPDDNFLASLFLIDEDNDRLWDFEKMSISESMIDASLLSKFNKALIKYDQTIGQLLLNIDLILSKNE